MLTLLVAAAWSATPFAGLEYQPLSRLDLTWVDDDRTSGVLAGEFDGAVAPSLQAFGGAWLSRRVGVVGSVGVARLTTTTWVEDTWRQRHWGVIRPAADLRVSLGSREPLRPSPWLYVGVHGDIPSARDTSNGYTEAEREVADEDAWVERARLGGVGGRLGVGLDYRVAPGVAVGARWGLLLHHGMLRTSEAQWVTAWFAADAALLLTFEAPKPRTGAEDQPVL